MSPRKGALGVVLSDTQGIFIAYPVHIKEILIEVTR